MQTVASSILDQLSPLVIDVETTTFNKGHPFDPRNRLVSYAYYTGRNDICFKYHRDPDFLSNITRPEWCPSDTLLVGFNIKFDLHWLCNSGWRPNGAQIWDCQLAEHIISGQQAAFLSLNEALESYGLPIKLDAVKEYWERGIDTIDIPINILEEYNKHDVLMTYELYKMQRALMTPEQIVLLLTEGEDMKTLVEAERNGFKWDRTNAQVLREKLHMVRGEILTRISGYLPDSFSDGVISFNWDSGDQLSALLYGGTVVYDYSVSEDTTYKSGPKKGEPYTRNRWFERSVTFPKRFTPVQGTEVKKTKDDPEATTRFYQVDDPTIQQLKSRKTEDKQLLSLLRERSAKMKVLEMIDSIEEKMLQKNWQDDTIHGQYNQNVAVTGRLSSSEPNMQNTPPEIDELLVSRYND